METDDRNDKLIRDLLSGRLSRKGRIELSELNLIKKKMKKQWNEPEGNLIRPEVGKLIWSSIEKRCKRKHFILVPSGLWRLSAAVVVVLLFISGAYIGLCEHSAQSKIYLEVVAQSNEMYLLPDSSKVWMQPGSSIRFAKEFNVDRRVWLTGNSLFEVRKQAGSIFRVYIEKAFIEVKGTCFLIKQNKTEESKITLFNGSIEFNIEGTGRQIVMRPMQEMTYNPVGAATELRQVYNVDWQNGKYDFTNIGLDRLVEIMNQMYDTEIRLETGINKESAFTGSIRHDEPLEDVIDKICFSLNLRKKDMHGKIIIYN